MRYTSFICLILASYICHAQTPDSVTARIILVGDGGALRLGKHPVVDAIRSYTKPDKKTTVVFLGDNLYTEGLPDESVSTYAGARTVLDSQVTVAEKTGAKVYMIPGNHDWQNGGINGWDAVRREMAYVNLLRERNVSFIPENGCPGPVEVPINDDVVMIVFDSQWWLHKYDKPGIDMDCESKTESEFLLQLSELLRKNLLKVVILACHHPFMSNGIHGGFFGFKQHIFPFTDLYRNLYIPLPVIGSIYPISRSVFGSPQDISHPTYTNMVAQIRQVTKAHPNVIYVAGHDHNLQLLKDDSGFNYIVSGGGSKLSRVAKSKNSEYVQATLGYSILDISKNKTVTARFYAVSIDTTRPREMFSKVILDFAKLPALAKDTTTFDVPAYKDFYTAPASNLYKNPSRLKKFFLGNNYRKAWAVPVKLKVFRLKEERGGFTIESLGGGKQTKSLNLVDKNGKKWALKTIDKDPEKAMPANFRNTIAESVVQDMISAAFPYGSLVVPPLAQAAKIPHATPEYFFVPDDPYFGYYRPLFANKICLLEEKDASIDGSDTKSSISVFNEMVEENDHRVEQQEVLKARLLDILVADFDRHLDQWKWGILDTGRGKLYYPIPKDRDQAFFYSNGLLVRWASRRRLPFLGGFRYRMGNINGLGWPAKDFDRVFLNELDKKQWETISTLFTLSIADSAIKSAVNKMPPEVYPINGDEFVGKLESRRKLLTSKAMVYYNFLAKYVNVMGSNQREYFHVTNEGDKIRVRVVAIKDKKDKEDKDGKKENDAGKDKKDNVADTAKKANDVADKPDKKKDDDKVSPETDLTTSLKDKDTSHVVYNRLFDPKETKEIRLYGFNGNDIFDISADKSGKTLLRIIGGRGADSFDIKGSIKNYLYDLSTEENPTNRGNRTRMRLSADPLVNHFDLNEFQYSFAKFPRLNLGYNPEDGMMAGLGFWYRKHGFRKKPYASDERLYSLFSFSQKAFQIHYRGTFIEAFNKTDILANARLLDPALDNFFGFGNSTRKDSAVQFYRVRYKTAMAEILFRRKLGNVLSVLVGPSFMYYWNRHENNKAYILAKPEIIGLDSMDVYSRKAYAGGKAGILIDNLNSDLFPTRGIQWYTEFTGLAALSKNAVSLTKIQSDMIVYASLRDPPKFVTVLKLGGGRIFSKDFEYFQALNLGANNFLRGFRKNRFSGSGMAYASLEFRIKLFDSKSYILPGQVGVVVFDEIGRVWYKNEVSKKWHNAYGGGLYYVPFNMVLVSATVGFSREEQLFNFSVGAKINLTF